MSICSRSPFLACAAAFALALAPLTAQAGPAKPPQPKPAPAPTNPGPAKPGGSFGGMGGAVVKSIGEGLSTLARKS